MIKVARDHNMGDPRMRSAVGENQRGMKVQEPLTSPGAAQGCLWSPCASDSGSPLCHPQARIRPLVIHSHSLQVSFHMCQVNILNIN